ncbi:hypothetical protein E2C01_044053 [Portunus trituberculatus]|uniref:Uncharacterized protein n=1 Tax=Portunus trituberculatus TaxID=210409 RepID=A0A5B7FYD0_PORTR|nr:hypothetical protein [Portunus trituberculatus]
MRKLNFPSLWHLSVASKILGDPVPPASIPPALLSFPPGSSQPHALTPPYLYTPPSFPPSIIAPQTSIFSDAFYTTGFLPGFIFRFAYGRSVDGEVETQCGDSRVVVVVVVVVVPRLLLGRRRDYDSGAHKAARDSLLTWSTEEARRLITGQLT